MLPIIIWDITILLFLGLAGWALFSFLHLPLAPFLGAITVISLLRALGVEVPLSPFWLFPSLQVLFGIYIGSTVTRETVRSLKSMIAPAAVIIVWAQSVAFLVGPLFSLITPLDLPTAILAFSMAGPAEMTIIAMAVDADPGFIIIVHMVRIVAVFSLFPFLLRRWISRQKKSDVLSIVSDANKAFSRTGEQSFPANKGAGNFSKRINSQLISINNALTVIKRFFLDFVSGKIFNYFINRAGSLTRLALILIMASLAGTMLNKFGVPAGIMVGAILFTALISVIGIETITIPPRIFQLMLVAMGICVADNILPERLSTFQDPRLLFFVAISIVCIFLSSLLIAYAINRFSGRDLPTCFLAAAPAGFVEMIGLAIENDMDSFFISMMLLCRMLSIKTIVPFVFMVLI